MPKILQLRISLNEIKPQIWRRFLVYDNISFEKLHNIIQEIMGWENYHLYEFNIDGEQLGVIDDDALDSNPDLKDSKKARLVELINKEKQKFSYLYDFGDSWEHEIIVEKILEDDGKQKLPVCLEGDRACPPEDCGAVSGYENLIEVKKDKNHPDYNELIIGWLGEEHDFEEFDIGEINRKLKRIR